MEQEDIFASDATDKGVNIQNIQTTHSTQQQQQESNPKMAEDLTRHFSKEDIQKGQQAHKKMLNVANYQKNAIQNYNEVSPELEWLSSKGLQTTHVGDDVEKREHLHIWWECKLVQSLWKTVWRFLKKLKQTNMGSSNSTPGYISGKMKTSIQKDMPPQCS